jgi:hypothetical protein
MVGAAELNLRSIHAHGGSQARAWEELAYQLRPAPGPNHTETRKTRAPDGGVEWYDVYADGHEEGFQAKFNASLADALGGMRESVEAVAEKRPHMTKLTFIVPYDFTDSGSAKSKSDQDRWEDAATLWREDFSWENGIEFAAIRGGDILERLSLEEHAGRRAFWFGGLDLTKDWFSRRWSESKDVVGDRYTPDADTHTGINQFIEAVAMSPRFLHELENRLKSVLVKCSHDPGMWGEHLIEIRVALDELAAYRDSVFDRRVDDVVKIATDGPDLASMCDIASKLGAIADAILRASPNRGERNLRAARNAARSLHELTGGRLAAGHTGQALAIVGPAGQGKTHALLRAARELLDNGVPAIVILGQRLDDSNWWPAIAATLGMTATNGDEFLQALDALAQSRNCRAVIFLDALNESKSPRRWREELPALLARIRSHRNIALVVSYRSDYREVISPPDSLPTVRHPGLAGNEAEALEAYCALFEIPVPARSLFDPAFGNPLFLRMYCEVLAAEPASRSEAPTRSNLFERFAAVRSRRVAEHLEVSPTGPEISRALGLVADLLLKNRGLPVHRESVESQVDLLLPGRRWPDTLFHQLVSNGVLEMHPGYDGQESVSFPFQAYSEHLLATRSLDVGESRFDWWPDRVLSRLRTHLKRRSLAKEIRESPWLWRAMSVLLPERFGVELVDLIPNEDDVYRLQEVTRDSLTERAPSSFGERALELLAAQLDDLSEDSIEPILSLAPRRSHPGNSDWLHEQLSALSMPDRDASWSIAAFQADQDSPALHRLARWAERLSPSTSDEEVRLAAVALMWLLTSPNRFLRDRVSKSLVKLLSERLGVAADLVGIVREVDDLYVQERVLTCAYGALMVGGDQDATGSFHVALAVVDWSSSGLPVHVLARDAARGIAAWSHHRGLISAAQSAAFNPPYGAKPPDEPPTAAALKARYGRVHDGSGEVLEWRADSILGSCLDWYGDFNKYVVKSDVDHFSLYSLSGPPPTKHDHQDPRGEVNGDWAGRWIAHRAISLGWTAERFADFEQGHDLHRGRDAHKAERFGKKYQWIAHHELLARLADNFHLAFQPWDDYPQRYEGPWPWSGRDFDPTLPPSVVAGESQTCEIGQAPNERWALLKSPDLDVDMSPDEWVALTDDLPDRAALFTPTDTEGRPWIALHRYSTWDRDNALRSGISRRERDFFILQFSWLTPRNQGVALRDLLMARGLGGRWMNDAKRTHGRYLGEAAWAPVVSFGASYDEHDQPKALQEVGLTASPAVESYLWEGNVLDCSIDQSVDFYTPTDELLGPARWVGHQAEWAVDGRIIARTLTIDDGENGQGVLLVDPGWLTGRLAELDAALVIGTLSERHARPTQDDHHRTAFSEIWYAALVDPGQAPELAGPSLRVKQRVGSNDQPSGPGAPAGS